MRASHLAPSAAVLALLAAAVASPACRTAPPGPEADLVVVGIDQRLRLGDRLPATSPVFDGQVVRARAARGETLALVVWYRGRRDVSLAAAPPGLHLQLAQLGAVEVTRGSTTMYGGGRGRGAYPDVVGPPLQPSPPGAGANLTALSGPLLLELEVEPGAAPGPARLAITIGDRVVPIELTVAATVVPGSAPTAWGYYDRRELRAHGVDADGERACVGMFARHGVMASPEMTEASWAEDGAALRAAGFPYVPVLLPRDPDQLERAVAWWVQATAGTGQVPFAIPIDEPKGAVAWAEVRTLADRVRAAGGGPGRFLYAVTDRPRAEYGDRVDLYISPFVPTLAGPAVPPGAAVWTYNGTPPWAGSMVVDAGGADLRTWGWIGWRYQIPVWYVWDVLYWHDRHNRRRRGEDPLGGPPAPRPGDAVSFDDGDDHGNLDGVLAVPSPEPRTGCAPTVRLLVLRQGLVERALLEALAACAGRAAADAVAAEVVPRALGDVRRGQRATWPRDAAGWAAGRAALFAALERCAPAR
ncbi:MAG: hypothetical protein KA190_22060 [Kofleriaceae bacterium]|nr:hypothetical protein [Kofleriaceae bacterium]